MDNRFFDEIVNESWTGKSDDIEGTVQNYIAPEEGVQSGLQRRRNPDWYTGKRATTGREGGAIVNEL